MRLQLYPFLLERMLELWGPSRQVWQEKISELVNCEVKLPNFFWEIEIPLRSQRQVTHITVSCERFTGWLPIVYRTNAVKDFETLLLQKLIKNLCSDNKKAG